MGAGKEKQGQGPARGPLSQTKGRGGRGRLIVYRKVSGQNINSIIKHITILNVQFAYPNCDMALS